MPQTLTMPRGTHRNLTRDIFIFFQKLKKKHKLIRDMSLTTLVNFVLEGPNWNTFSEVGMQLTLF